ncbi:hypothetical protein HJFPF1_00242 [Paramyrothecium foliicola]|nr:hypothetical protein HJFPF1_00242 [Paramyrothecium foliicola]
MAAISSCTSGYIILFAAAISAYSLQEVQPDHLLSPLTGNPLTEFESPSPKYRPKFRYWLPDANIDHEILENDILEIGNIGGGGLEFVPFYNYGFGTPDITNWDVYAFGKPAYKTVLLKALKTCEANDLVMDYALGASQGQGVPIEPLTPGLAVQLVYGKTTVQGGAKFQGHLPEPILKWRESLGFMQPQEQFGNSRLIGVSAAGIKATYHSDDGDIHIALDETSLVDLSEAVVDEQLTWHAPSDHEQYVLFAHYERFTNQRSCVGIPADVVANGSWVTDHFDAAGAKLVTTFWEQNLLDAEIRELLQRVGQHSWEDSMEIQASLYWTPALIDRFTANRGYNPTKYLPLLFHQSNSFHGSEAPYNTTYYLDGDENPSQNKYLQDYRITLSEGYVEYLRALDAWSQSLGTSHSCQVAYNLPVNLPASVPLVSGPELESLGFTNVDHMLQFVGPAHFGGGNIVSTEIGATPTGGYSQTLPSLLQLFHDAFAGGVNMMIMHGMQYGGEQPNTTWPGYTPFAYRFADMWSPRQPAWNYMAESMNYTARSQLILQSGVAKKDLAFYLFKDPWRIGTVQQGTNLREMGFTYEYISPSNLEAENATVSEGVLAPCGPGYRALIIDQQSYISPGAARKLLEMANEGLPIVVIGPLPNNTIGSDGQDIVSERMSSLVSAGYANVKFIQSSDSLLEALGHLSIKPRVRVDFSSPSEAVKDLHTLWRSDGEVDYILLYNKGHLATYNISVEATEDKSPYRLDAWTGAQEPIPVYRRSPAALNFQVTLQSQQTAFVAVAPGNTRDYVTSHSENIAKIVYGSNSRMSVLLDNPHEATLTMSTNHVHYIPPITGNTNATMLEFEVKPWNLTIESWIPDSNVSISKSAKEALHLGPQVTLLPWSEISGAENVSGIGTYDATFNFPNICQLQKDQLSAIIYFGPVFNTLRAWVNGKQLPPIDAFDAKLDISDYLVTGTNSIRVETASTMFNAVKARVNFVKTYGFGPLDPELYTSVDWQAHGLVGPVRVKMLRKHCVLSKSGKQDNSDTNVNDVYFPFLTNPELLAQWIFVQSTARMVLKASAPSELDWGITQQLHSASRGQQGYTLALHMSFACNLRSSSTNSNMINMRVILAWVILAGASLAILTDGLWKALGFGSSKEYRNENPLVSQVETYRLHGGKWAPYCQYGPTGIFQPNQLDRCLSDHAKHPGWRRWPCAGKIWQHFGKDWKNPAHCYDGCVPCLREAAARSANWARCLQKKPVWATCNIGWSKVGKIICGGSLDTDHLHPCNDGAYGEGVYGGHDTVGRRWPYISGTWFW